MVTLSPRQLTVPVGQSLPLDQVSWQDFEEILGELGESRSSRLAYNDGILEIMTPLPEHEYFKTVMGDVIKIWPTSWIKSMKAMAQRLGEIRRGRRDWSRTIVFIFNMRRWCGAGWI